MNDGPVSTASDCLLRSEWLERFQIAVRRKPITIKHGEGVVGQADAGSAPVPLARNLDAFNVCKISQRIGNRVRAPLRSTDREDVVLHGDGIGHLITRLHCIFAARIPANHLFTMV